MSLVAALFVQADGVYANRHDIDAWPESRDARLYAGPHPVVAHPPCQLWGRFAAINFKRWGGEHNRPGNDGGCFESALKAVRAFGGVLEHPADSKAWSAFGLTKPTGIGWKPNNGGGWVCEVWQSAYGHQARKRTWLYYCSHPGDLSAFHGWDPGAPDLRWDRPDGTHQIGFHDQRGKARNKPTISGKRASATPPEFADELIRLARASRGNADDFTRAKLILEKANA